MSPTSPDPVISISMASRYKAGGESWVGHLSNLMAQLNKDFFVNNKDKHGSWEVAWLLGTSVDPPLPKTCQEAMFSFLATGNLDYLPDDSDTILNALTNGLGDLEPMNMCIPEKCKYILLYFESNI